MNSHVSVCKGYRFFYYFPIGLWTCFWLTRNEDRRRPKKTGDVNEDREHVLQFNIDVALLLDRANNKYSICQKKKVF